MSQVKNYLELLVRAETRKMDSSYHAAFYLLSFDSELSKVAEKYVDEDGVDFAAIKRATRGFDEISRQVIDIAHNLFSWTSKCKTTPFDLSRLGYPYLELACNAVFIAAGEYQITLDAENTNNPWLQIDRSNYQRTVRLHQSLEQMHLNMLEQRDEEMDMEQ